MGAVEEGLGRLEGSMAPWRCCSHWALVAGSVAKERWATGWAGEEKTRSKAEVARGASPWCLLTLLTEMRFLTGIFSSRVIFMRSNTSRRAPAWGCSTRRTLRSSQAPGDTRFRSQLLWPVRGSRGSSSPWAPPSAPPSSSLLLQNDDVEDGDGGDEGTSLEARKNIRSYLALPLSKILPRARRLGFPSANSSNTSFRCASKQATASGVPALTEGGSSLRMYRSMMPLTSASSLRYPTASLWLRNPSWSLSNIANTLLPSSKSLAVIFAESHSPAASQNLGGALPRALPRGCLFPIGLKKNNQTIKQSNSAPARASSGGVHTWRPMI